MIEPLARCALNEAADVVGLERVARRLPLIEGRRHLDLVLVEQALVDPQRAGIGCADRQGCQLAVGGETVDPDLRDLALPVRAEGIFGDRSQILGEALERGHASAGLKVEDVRTARRRECGPERRLIVIDRDHLVVHLDVGELLVEGRDVRLRHRHVGGPPPPVDGALGCRATATTAAGGTARQRQGGQARRGDHGDDARDHLDPS